MKQASQNTVTMYVELTLFGKSCWFHDDPDHGKGMQSTEPDIQSHRIFSTTG
jgi:hypothetical protein